MDGVSLRVGMSIWYWCRTGTNRVYSVPVPVPIFPVFRYRYRFRYRYQYLRIKHRYQFSPFFGTEQVPAHPCLREYKIDPFQALYIQFELWWGNRWKVRFELTFSIKETNIAKIFEDYVVLFRFIIV
ncbi:hypothetical protein HanRHA438_Chr15g0706731 [Helianthus annuus]|uniref:Uncharacterized protein n=1 Tax=Helianthus annuus TaxID=4232 RepID=A0A9K3E0D0_HELAN|nr:hypothetical protein HanXRQr2_Chr15g0694321 [Helianthus annuus]KAJ0451286.1 hypothetical protein HanHA300_Chr15g0565841 [Helianthus annuus]KAJ0455757.1 hypothetical protein HanIR_Chr15g0754731 [Helianthus annuus]KAJ0473155.1 hypothetical protein HanHA89_Chr15g0615121 [Helianthus annuus]KAJ0648757.1 hypothetical protein HanLR1_Chr15g0576481 [Helianthus annuus]